MLVHYSWSRSLNFPIVAQKSLWPCSASPGRGRGPSAFCSLPAPCSAFFRSGQFLHWLQQPIAGFLSWARRKPRRTSRTLKNHLRFELHTLVAPAPPSWVLCESCPDWTGVAVASCLLPSPAPSFFPSSSFGGGGDFSVTPRSPCLGFVGFLKQIVFSYGLVSGVRF